MCSGGITSVRSFLYFKGLCFGFAAKYMTHENEVIRIADQPSNSLRLKPPAFGMLQTNLGVKAETHCAMRRKLLSKSFHTVLVR